MNSVCSKCNDTGIQVARGSDALFARVCDCRRERVVDLQAYRAARQEAVSNRNRFNELLERAKYLAAGLSAVLAEMVANGSDKQCS
jgi:hypothetical protein